MSVKDPSTDINTPRSPSQNGSRTADARQMLTLLNFLLHLSLFLLPLSSALTTSYPFPLKHFHLISQTEPNDTFHPPPDDLHFPVQPVTQCGPSDLLERATGNNQSQQFLCYMSV